MTACLNPDCTQNVGEDFDAQSVFRDGRMVGRAHARCLPALESPRDFDVPWDAERHMDADGEAGMPEHLRTPFDHIDPVGADAA